MKGFYYLHVNGDLIWKKDLDNGQEADFRESDLVKMFWPCDTEDRETLYRVLIEACALDLKKDRLIELALKWGVDNDDAQIYADRVGCKLTLDGNSWMAARMDFVNLGESVAGFGDNKLEAMIDLCKKLGYKASKMWGASFKDKMWGASFKDLLKK